MPDHWQDFGEWLTAQRAQVNLSRRRAARLSEVSDTIWKQYEQGYKREGDERLPPNPTEITLHKMASVLPATAHEVCMRARGKCSLPDEGDSGQSVEVPSPQAAADVAHRIDSLIAHTQALRTMADDHMRNLEQLRRQLESIR